MKIFFCSLTILGALFFWQSCGKSSDHLISLNGGLQIDREQLSGPKQYATTLPESDISFPFKFVFHKYAWAPFADLVKQGLSIAPGWGYMAPMVVVDEQNNQYALMYFACEPQVKKFYCVYLMKNGEQYSDVHIMGIDLIEQPLESRSAYQPPALFYRNNELLMAYEVGAKSGSTINLVSLNLSAPNESFLRWQKKSEFHSPQSTINYLGSAMGPQGEIYLAGLETLSSSETGLALLRVREPYLSWDSKQMIRKFSGKKQVPVYSHVQVRKTGEVEILSTLHNSTVCSESNLVYSESYKTVVSYRGEFGAEFVEYWRNSANDVSGVAEGGDSCLFHHQRFGLAQFYDASNDAVYSLIKASDVSSVNPNDRVGSNARFKRRFILYKNDQIVVSDLSIHTASYFSNPNDIWAFSGTRLSNGIFVFAAANDGLIGSLEDIALISTSDLVQFSPVFRLRAIDLPEHSVHFGQPYKNGSNENMNLHFFHSGTVYSELNLQHRYNFYVADPL